MNSISTVGLEDNLIDDNSMKEFGEYLASRKVEEYGTSLDVVLLGGNKIGDEGAKAMAIGLKKCTTLHRFHIPNNKLTDVGIKAILEGLHPQMNVINFSKFFAKIRRNVTE